LALLPECFFAPSFKGCDMKKRSILLQSYLRAGGLILAVIVSGLRGASCLAGTAGLPPHLKWQTNDKAPLFASEQAERGGTLKTHIASYPLTFRQVGPNSNSSFDSFIAISCRDFSLVAHHPNTLQFIPQLATHWAVMPDQKTVYFKLDPDVTFSDGVKVTADHYVFAYQFVLSEHIKDPSYNKYYSELLEKVEKIDDYTLKIVGRYPSWRALHELNITPMPRHALKLDGDWVRRDNWTPPVCVGPYVIDKVKPGHSITFKRVPKWWGDRKRYLAHRYNFDEISVRVIRDEKVAFEHFKKGELSYFTISSAAAWEKETDFEEVKRGWIGKKRVYTRSHRGLYGIALNLRTPLFRDVKVRQALSLMFDFEKLNRNLMYGAYERITSFFDGTEYEDPRLSPYPFDAKKAAELLDAAGFRRRGPDGIRVSDQGERCSFTLTYGSAGFERHFSVYAEDLRVAGVEMKLRLVDGSKMFKDRNEKNYEAIFLSSSGGIYPSPGQYLHSDFAAAGNNNNVFAYSNPQVDLLIATYEKDLSFEKRKQAIFCIDKVVRDEAFYLPFWSAPYVRVLYWNNLVHTPEIEPKYSSAFNDYHTWWFSKKRDEELQQAISQKKTLKTVDNAVDHDPHNIKRK
jgi:microcin C transport system substrate-binding protein